jgi:hypothetical protein
MSVIKGNKAGLKFRDWQASSGTRAHESERQCKVAGIYNCNKPVRLAVKSVSNTCVIINSSNNKFLVINITNKH